MAITVGTDPEFFVREIESQSIVPGCDRIGGSKVRPLPLPGMPPGFGIQEDNVMAELTVPPSLSEDAFVSTMAEALNSANEYLADRGLELVLGMPTYEFGDEVLGRYAGATVVGCSPDFHAYSNGAQRSAITAEGLGAYRYCGGHIHIGVTPNCPMHIAVMFADMFIGLPLVQNREHQGFRRGLYGQAGVYRPTPYGFEYRTPSNFWTTSEQMTGFVARQAFMLGEFLEGDATRIRNAMMGINWRDVRTAIHEEDYSSAHRLYQNYHALLS